MMIDPVLSGFDMPLLIDVLLTEEQVPRLDSILFTHCGNDHYSRTTCKAMSPVVSSFHAARYAVSLLESELKIAGKGHDIGEMFSIGPVHVRLTPAWATCACTHPGAISVSFTGISRNPRP